MKNFFYPFSLFILIAFFVQSCKMNQTVTEEIREVTFDTLTVRPEEVPEYRASNTRTMDLIHTKLEVSFDWDSTYLYGKAYLTFKPYFYESDSLILDAKGFQILDVALIDSVGRKSKLNYTYDSLKLRIGLDTVYTRNDEFSIYIDYVSMPNKLDAEGSEAITSDKGLYFINADGSDPKKPKQIWTQGETEASSAWFPTIDSPNERMTQEIYITVDTAYISLSNGTLMFQTENGDGTRTDYWKQDIPDAPYLTMMAIGDFAMVEDKWRDKPVNYYVEPKYKDIARDIYPNTVEMMEFFSTILGVTYPWDKYDQIVVRDYVSGAMENTSAVIYGDFIQGDKRYLIDNSGEDIVAHELIHHWFGNLVTTESWSNLPLNESFATYGEYLWNEFKYGKDQADYGRQNDFNAYLQEAEVEEKELIRFHYGHRMEMFDRHSYQKGGLVLHMLRNYVGDEAFFTSLKKYLQDNAYKSVEIHNLRLAFEEVTGEDLNWFFNQWFMQKGHPVIKTKWEYSDSTNTVTLSLEQTQEGDGIVKVFQLPMSVDIYYNDERQREKIVMNKRKQKFTFSVPHKPIVVNVDGEKNLLAEFIEEKELHEWQALYECGGNYLSRYQSIINVEDESDSLSLLVMQKALKDPFWGIRRTAIVNVESLANAKPKQTLSTLENLAEKDPKSDVRALSIIALGKYFKEDVSLDLLQKMIYDSSYVVVASALISLYEKDENAGIKAANSLETLNSDEVKLSIADVYATSALEDKHDFFIWAFESVDEYSKYSLAVSYNDYLMEQNQEIVAASIPIIEKEALNTDVWWIRMTYYNILTNLKERFSETTEMEEDINPTNTDNESILQQIQSSIDRLKEKEDNPNLKKMLGE